MGTHERMAIAAVVAGLRKSGAINDNGVTAIADELAKAAQAMQGFNAAGYDQMVALTADVAAGRVTRHLPD